MKKYNLHKVLNIVLSIVIIFRGFGMLTNNILEDKTSSVWCLAMLLMFKLKNKALKENSNWAINIGIIIYGYWFLIEVPYLYSYLITLIYTIFTADFFIALFLFLAYPISSLIGFLCFYKYKSHIKKISI